MDACAHGDRAAPLAEGLGAVDDEVHDDLFELSLVGLDRGQALRQPGDDPHALGQAHLEQREGVTDHQRLVRRLDDEGAAPGVGEHLPGEVRGPLDGGCRLLDVTSRRIALGHLGHSQ